jgi:SAM-dependent methyltransferase
MDNKQHWDQVYKTKEPDEVSWTQPVPQSSLDLIHDFALPKSASIIDVGGGDSKLVDHLLEEGYENITVLDISEVALHKAKQRLGEKAKKIKWIVSDITQFTPDQKYDLWHDRAAFHFLTTSDHINQYTSLVNEFVTNYLVIGLFSENGPTKCSGLPVKQYSKHDLSLTFSNSFDKINCINEDHITPFNTRQNFLFCSFKKHN